MRKEIIYCDICKEEGAVPRYFKVGRQMDPTGSMEDVSELLDLCPKHQWKVYVLAEQLLTYSQTESVLLALKERRVRV